MSVCTLVHINLRASDALQKKQLSSGDMMVAPQTVGQAASALEQALEYLNDGSDSSVVYAMTFNAELKAWRVVKLQRVEHNRVHLNESLYKIVPAGTDHNSLSQAIRDAIVLRQAEI